MNNPLQRRGLKLRAFLEPSPCATAKAKAARGWRGQGEATKYFMEKLIILFPLNLMTNCPAHTSL